MQPHFPFLQLLWVTTQSPVVIYSSPSFCLFAKSFHQWQYHHHLLKFNPSCKEQVTLILPLPFPIPQAFCTMLEHPFSHFLPWDIIRMYPWVGRSPGEGNSNALQYSCLGNPTDRGAWQAIIHRVAELNMMTGLNMHACSADLRRPCTCSPISWYWDLELST